MRIVRRCDGCGICNAEACPTVQHLCVECGRTYKAYSAALYRANNEHSYAAINLLNSYIRSYLIAEQAGYWIPPAIKKGPSVR